jgi:hypothetical protein
MSPLNAAICTTISYTLWVEWYYNVFKKQLFDLKVKGHGPKKVIMVRDTPPYGHAPTYQLSLTYLERQKCYGPDKKILFKKQLFDLEVKGQGPTQVITVYDTGVSDIFIQRLICWCLGIISSKCSASKLYFKYRFWLV